MGYAKLPPDPLMGLIREFSTPPVPIPSEFRSSIRILCIDDDPSFGRILAKIAKHVGLAFTYCGSLDEISRLQDNKINLAIIDYDMGDVTGVELTRYLDRILGNVIVILVTQGEIDVPRSEWPKSVKVCINKSRGHRSILAAAVTTFALFSRTDTS